MRTLCMRFVNARDFDILIALEYGHSCPDSDATARYTTVDVCEKNQEIGVLNRMV